MTRNTRIEQARHPATKVGLSMDFASRVASVRAVLFELD